MSDLGPWIYVAGVLALTASVYVYLKTPSKSNMFPVILALGGIFMCAAQTVRASIRGVGEIEFDRKVAAASDVNSVAVVAQANAIEKLGEDLKGLREAFVAYQKVVDGRLAALDGHGGPGVDPRWLEADTVLQERLARVRRSRMPVEKANAELKQATSRMFR